MADNYMNIVYERNVEHVMRCHPNWMTQIALGKTYLERLDNAKKLALMAIRETKDSYGTETTVAVIGAKLYFKAKEMGAF